MHLKMYPDHGQVSFSNQVFELGRENWQLALTYFHENHGQRQFLVERDYNAGGDQSTTDPLQYRLPFGEPPPAGSYDTFFRRDVDETGRRSAWGDIPATSRQIAYSHIECAPRDKLQARVVLTEMDIAGEWPTPLFAVGAAWTAASAAVGVKVPQPHAKAAGWVSALVGIGIAALGLDGNDVVVMDVQAVPRDTTSTVLFRATEAGLHAMRVEGLLVTFVDRTFQQTGGEDPCALAGGTHVDPDQRTGALFDPFRQAASYAALIRPLPGSSTKFTGPGFEERAAGRVLALTSLAGLAAGLEVDAARGLAGGAEAVALYEEAQGIAQADDVLAAIEAYAAAFHAAASAVAEDQPAELVAMAPEVRLALPYVVTEPGRPVDVTGAVLGLDGQAELTAMSAAGVPSGADVQVFPGHDLEWVVLDHELAADLRTGYPVGTGRIGGAAVADPDDACDERHLVAAGPQGITVDGSGPYAQPEGTCGYGRLMVDPMPHPGTAVPDGASFAEGLFRVRFDPCALPRGIHSLRVRAELATADGPLQITAPLRVFVDGAAGATPRGIDAACPDGEVEEGTFADVPADSPHALAVDCAAHHGITTGTAPGAYTPAGSTRRDQMASFLARLVSAHGGTLPEDPPDAFDDDGGNVHETAINQLAAAGVVRGTATGVYSPAATVSRGQMASFLARTFRYLAGQDLPAGIDYFTDDDHSVHHDAINAVAGAGIAAGLGVGAYSPEGLTRRDQMASFLARLLDALRAAPAPDPELEPSDEHSLEVRVQSGAGELPADDIDVDPPGAAHPAGEQVQLTAPQEMTSDGYQHYFAMWTVEPEVPHEVDGQTLWVVMEDDVTATAYYESVPVESNSVGTWGGPLLVR